MKKVWYYEKENKNATLGFTTEDSMAQIIKDLRANNCVLVAVYNYDTDTVKVYSDRKEFRVMADYEWKANL
jgi:hypothetical protein